MNQNTQSTLRINLAGNKKQTIPLSNENKKLNTEELKNKLSTLQSKLSTSFNRTKDFDDLTKLVQLNKEYSTRNNPNSQLLKKSAGTISDLTKQYTRSYTSQTRTTTCTSGTKTEKISKLGLGSPNTKEMKYYNVRSNIKDLQ